MEIELSVVFLKRFYFLSLHGLYINEYLRGL